VIIQLLSESGGTLAAPISYGAIYSLEASTGRGHVLYGDGGSAPDIGLTRTKASWGRMLARLPGDDRYMLMEAQEFYSDEPAKLVKMDVDSGRWKELVVAPLADACIMTDELGEPRIAIAEGLDLRPRYFYRAGKDAAWNELATLKGFKRGSAPMAFESEVHTVIVAEGMEKGFGVFAHDVATGEEKLLSKNDWVTPSGKPCRRRRRSTCARATGHGCMAT
jgi:hypothetical protein